MTLIEWKEHKGFCLSHDEPAVGESERERFITNGLACLPWDAYTPDLANGGSELMGIGGEVATLSMPCNKKLSKSEKRELRQSKKINAQKKRQMKRQVELDKYGDEVEASFKPYLAKQEIKHIYTNVILHTTDTGKNFLSKGEDFKVLQYHSIALYKSDLEHLLPGEWLNDNDISFVYELIIQLFIKSDQCRDFANQIQLLFPSLVQLLQHFPADDIENLLPMDDLIKSRFLFLPISFIDKPSVEIDMEDANNGDHWALGVLSLLDNKLFVYDSMKVDNDINGDTQLQALCKRLESCSKLVKGKIKVVHMNCDQQKNFDDCGVFVIMFTCYFIGQFLFHDEISMDIGKVQFNPLDARLYIMKLIAKLTNRSNGK
ncbi:hypothetical protein KGF56_000995 [Candida oxycetoniae]|uniref:Ubiquitin-like protease family profile domain-containing protein n=1 Tax=Candida oxycetoniae TaxID=497107 RepID=A0AAI9SZR4_9ASCO|nr:uncharacterized protein KGF56_000995 [Candida oxycetoniae]KAI3406153.2 hypothetical protein KGF56_000995 [Candida oxycetoniae]